MILLGAHGEQDRGESLGPFLDRSPDPPGHGTMG
jgi:hypothetical protein